MKVIGKVRQLIQIREHGAGIFCPEYKAVHHRRGKAHIADLPGIDRVAHQRIAIPQPLKKPPAVIGG